MPGMTGDELLKDFFGIADHESATDEDTAFREAAPPFEKDEPLLLHDDFHIPVVNARSLRTRNHIALQVLADYKQD